MSEQEDSQAEGSQQERLARFLAHAGVASRRHAEELIAAGRVQVNGETVTVQGTRVDPARDRVTVDGRRVEGVERKVYVALHKPVGYVTTVRDPQGRATVLDLLPRELRRVRLYPVGRLDSDSAGLLLLTNDGDFALRLSHPRYGKEKEYEARVEGRLTRTELAALEQGVVITEDGGGSFKTAPARVRVVWASGDESWVALTIHEGHKRQVRRMLAAVGHPVRELVRVGIGSLRLGGLVVGGWRYLTEDEVKGLLE